MVFFEDNLYAYMYLCEYNEKMTNPLSRARGF